MSALALGLTLPFSSFGAVALTPPTVAPVLTADVAFGGYEVTLEWTASNKTGSAGFSYAVETSRDGSSFNRDALTTLLSYVFSVSVGDEGAWYFRVVPYNDAGDGPSSNVVSVTIPGI